MKTAFKIALAIVALIAVVVIIRKRMSPKTIWDLSPEQQEALRLQTLEQQIQRAQASNTFIPIRPGAITLRQTQS